MIEYFLELVSGLSPELATAILATFPVTELRAALPIGITVFGLDPLSAFSYAVLGNMIPLAIVFLIFPSFVTFIKKNFPSISKFLDQYFLALEKKYKEKYDRWGAVALIVLVAIPLPGSGVWTGSLLAILFGVEKRFSVPAILIGLGISGLIVLLITQGALSMLEFLL